MDQEVVTDIPTDIQESNFTQALTSNRGAYPNFHNFIETLRFLQDQELDCVIGVSGSKGVGKSTFALQGTRIYLEKYYPDISLLKEMKRFVLFDNEEVYDNLMNEEKFLPLNLDEALRFMMGQDHAKTENKDMKRLFGQIRIKYRLIWANVPDFFWLDSKYRESMMEFWVHIIGRGKAILFAKDRKIGVKDAWHRKEFEAMRGNVNMFTPVEKIIEMYKKHPCFLDILTFPDIDANLKKKYKEMREASLLTQSTQINTSRVSAKDIVWAYALAKEGKTLREISVIIKRPLTTIQTWVLQMNLIPYQGFPIEIKEDRKGRRKNDKQYAGSVEKVPPLSEIIQEKV